jgi:hypothetical protein
VSLLIAILFWSMSLAACLYALTLGGWEGRWTTVVILLASVATLTMNRWLSYHYREEFWATTNDMVFAIDLITFLAMYAIAGLSERWWPVWVAAFQLNSVIGHLATLISPEFSALVYQGYEGLWAIPGQLVMVFGIYRDRKSNKWKRRYDLA